MIMDAKTLSMNDLSWDQLSRVYAQCARLTGFFPFEGRDFSFVGTRLLVVFLVVGTMMLSAMFIVYNIETLVMGRPIKSEDIYQMVISWGMYHRYYTVLWRRELFVELFEECHQLWQFCDAKGRATVKSYERKIRWIYGIYAVNSFLGVITVSVTAYQMICILIGTVCQSSCETSTAFLMMLAVGYFRQLSDRMEAITSEHVDLQEERKTILNCIEYHQRLLKYCCKLQNFVEVLLFTQILASMFGLSLVLLKLAGLDPSKYDHVPILLLCIGVVFMTQWIPDQLAKQSEEVALAAYNVLTRHLHDRAFCRDLHVTLTRAQVPLQLKAAGFIELSLENFTSMMKGAYSFFTVLRNFDIE